MFMKFRDYDTLIETLCDSFSAIAHIVLLALVLLGLPSTVGIKSYRMI